MKKLLITLGSIFIMMFASQSAIAQCPGDVTPPTAVCQNLDLYLDGSGVATITASDVDGGSFDNCPFPQGGITLVGIDRSVFTCANIGSDSATNIVTLTVRDASGNTSTCEALMTVYDSIAPNAVCQNITVNLDGTGNATIIGSDLDGGSTDGCGTPALFSASITSFTCADIGPNNVWLTVTDNNGNVDSCMAVVTIADTVAPLALCKDETVYLNAFGTVSISPSLIDNGSVDICSAVTLALSQTTFNCDSLGPRTVELYVTDAAGNSDTCSSTLTILDALAPNVFTNNLIAYLDSTGEVVIDVAAVNNGSSDNCAIDTMYLKQDTFYCADAGLFVGTFYAEDSTGNIDSANFNVAILDTIFPAVFCQDTTVYLNAAGLVAIDSSYLDSGSWDNCNLFLTLSQSTFTCNDTGANTITLTAKDASGNTSICTSTVTVLDTIAPVLTIQPATIQLDVLGAASVLNSDVVASLIEACLDKIIITPRDFTCDSIGVRNVQVIAIDQSGNSDTMTAVVTVEDNISPTAIGQDTTIYLDADGGFRIDSSFINNASFDNCSIETIALSNDTFSCIHVGITNTVFMTVTDTVGNSSSTSVTVTVLDTIAPVAVCQDTTIYLDGSGYAAITPYYVMDTSTTLGGGSTSDNCSFVPTISQSTFACSDTGENFVTLYITDASGNIDSCTSTVTVLDTITPVLTTKPVTVYLDSMGNVTLVDSNVVLGIAEACLDTVIVTPRDFSCDSIGNRTVEVIAIDESGNADTASAVVTIVDNISPDAQCKDTTVYLDANGGFRIDSSYIENGSSDNCSVLTITLSNDTFSCVNAGEEFITMTVTDSSQNTSTCTAKVTVLDTIKPIAKCKDTTIYLDATGNFNIDATFLDNGSNDNCIFTDSLSTYTFTCSDTGANYVMLYITDASGNIDSCESKVTVKDNIAPTATCKDITIYLTDSGQVIIDSSFIDGGFSDNCSFTAALSDTLFTCADIGPNLITVILTDASGNTASCLATITIIDSIAPVVICKDTTIYLDASGSAIIFPIDVNDGSYDNCYSVNLNTDATTFSCTDIGLNDVLLIGTDPSGNVDTCRSIVTVLDTFGPTALCMDTTIYLDATGSFTIDSSFVDNGSSDDCSGVILSLLKSTYTCADVGISSTTLYVTDTSGNIDSCTAKVTVLDTIAPVAICMDTTIYLDASGNVTITPYYARFTTFDQGGTYENCSYTSTLSQSVFTCADTGANSVIVTIEDPSGNKDSCTSTVTVLDTLAPTAICKNATIFLDSMGIASIGLSDINDGSFDNCSIDTMFVSKSTFTCADLGTNSFTLTVVDVNGNIDSCTGTVTVYDVLSPYITCKPDTLYLGVTGVDTAIAMNLVDSVWDNCSFIVTASPTIFDCSTIGINPVNVTVTDADGRTSSCYSNLTVLDTVSPIAQCKFAIVYLNAIGLATITVADIDDGSSDNCGIATMTLSQTSFDCTNEGSSNPVTLTVTDASGNVSSCTVTVSVIDTISPVASCQNVTVYLDATGIATIDSTDIDNGSTDNCGIATIAISDVSFDCTDLGANTVTVTVTDNNGNSSKCSSVVTVIDNVNPTANCKDDTAYLDATGNVSITTADVNNSSTDNCAFTMSLSNSSFTCADEGVNTVTLYVTDAFGNLSLCNSNVTVLDTLNPIAICNSPTVYLNAIGLATITVGDINNASTDNCAIASMTISKGSFDCSNIGANTVTLTVTDASGNVSKCTSTVTVEDNTAPIAICQDITVYLDATGNVTIDSTDTDNGSTDNCTISTIALSQTAFDCTHVGTNTVLVTVTDNSGNSSTCSSTVTVIDNISPTAICKDTIVYLDATGNVSINTSYVDNGSSDACAFTMTLSDTAFTCADAGVNAVTLTVTDASGNSSFCNSNVTVLDTLNPTAICNSPTVYLNAIGLATITVGDIDNVSTDNCAIASMTISKGSFDCSNIGANSVTLTVTDASGNGSKCTSTVTVLDTTAPDAICQDIIVYLDATGNVTIDSTDTDNGSTDNCTISTIVLSQTAFDCTHVGTNTVLVTVTDNSGNSSTCSSTVTVIDDVNPAAICKDTVVYLDATGNVSINTTYVDGGSSDACAFTMTLSDTAFTCADAGVNAVTLTVTDASGNSSFCNSNVTVLDTTAPMAMCQDVTVYLNAIGAASITVGDIDNGSNDNCAIDSMSISTSSFDCSNLGANTVTLTVTDVSGNVSTCTSTVTVLDTTAPMAICQDITVYLDSTGNVTIDSTDTDNGSTDNCTISTIALSRTTFDCTNIGVNTVTVTVTDNSGNSSICSSTVTVLDNISPTAICKADTVYLDATGNTIITTANVDGGSSDNCSSITMTISDSLFNCIDTGANTVTLYVSDVSGNVSLCTSIVTVLDTTAPIVNCLSPTVYLDALGNVSISVADIDNGSTDNCTIASRTISNSTFNCSNLGANSVTLIVTDVSGNVDSCVATVTVLDTINPIARCKSATVYLNALGSVVITSLDLDNGSTDNCIVTTIALSRTIFTCNEVGLNNVTVIVTDFSGNVDSCIALLTVLDTLAPTAVCQNITIQLDSNGNSSIVALDVDGGSFDNCGIASIVVNRTDFDCSSLGLNTVVLTVTDIYGNASSCSATVTVEDNIAPIVYCPANKRIIVKNTNCSYIVEDFTGETSTWDNCSVNAITVTQSPLAGTQVFLENASQTITITSTDGSLNTSTCSFEVYVGCVKALNIPQFFSPDGSGKNDTWEIPELAIYPENTVKVFNRWGNLVFEQKGYYTGWNGSANVNRGATRLLDNKTLPEGTYYYIIDLGVSSIEPYVGYLQLKR